MITRRFRKKCWRPRALARPWCGWFSGRRRALSFRTRKHNLGKPARDTCLFKKLRAYIDENYPGASFCAKPTNGRKMCGPILATGMNSICAPFPIMPRIYMAIKKGRADDLLAILSRTPPIPENCQWCTFLRNHDELTWKWSPRRTTMDVGSIRPEPRMRLNLGIRRRLAPCWIMIAARSNLSTLYSSPCPVHRSFIMEMR